MARTWKDWVIQAPDLAGGTHQFDIVLSGLPSRPATLLRTLCWWGASGVIDAADLSALPVVNPVGFFLEDAFSNNNPGPAHVGDSPWSIDAVDAVLTGYSDWDYGPYQSATHVNGTATIGITGDLTYDLTLAQQRLAYINAGGYIDSHAQREWFSPNPLQFTFNVEMAGLTIGAWTTPLGVNFWARLRFLYQTV